MKKISISNMTKMFLIPTLLIGGLSACGYNKGARTNVYDGVRPYSTDGVRPYTTDGTRPLTTPYTTEGARPYTTDGVRSYGTNYTLDKTVADRAVKAATNVSGVSRASAVVRAKDIVIGIEGKSGTNVKALEKQVHDTVKSKEPGYNVHVTSDANMNTRIRTMYTTMTNPNSLTPGHPVRDFGRDMGDMIRDIGRTVTAPFR